MNGSSYLQLLLHLRNSMKRQVNLRNSDNECFRRCHVRHLRPRVKNPQRITKDEKSFVKELNYNGIEFPVTKRQYNKVEKNNHLRINVFGYEQGQPYPIYISKENFEDQMNLLLITNDDNKHYVLIQDFNAFMFNQTKHKAKKHFCMRCLQCFSSESNLEKHTKPCIQVNGAQAVQMPKKVKTL